MNSLVGLGECVNRLGELRVILIRLNTICIFSFSRFPELFSIDLVKLACKLNCFDKNALGLE